MLRHYGENGTLVDRLWYATSEPLNQQETDRIPEAIGLLVVNSGAIKVIRPAETPIIEYSEQQELLRALLREASRS